jgi:hypothetical protein
MISKSLPLVLALFTLMMVLAVPSVGVPLQTATTADAQGLGAGVVMSSLAQSLIDDEANTDQDSSSDDNTQENENEFGEDVALEDQDNLADQDAINLGVQEQEAEQDAEQEQDAANLNVDSDVQVGEQIEQQPPPPPTEEPPTEEPPTEEPPTEEPPTEPPGTPPPPPPPEVPANFFCFTISPAAGINPVASVPGEIRVIPISNGQFEPANFCFNSEQECEEFRAGVVNGRLIGPCEPHDEPPPGLTFCPQPGGEQPSCGPVVVP